MALSEREGQFGVHSVTLYNRTTKVPIAIAKVIGECTVNLEAELVDLMGGSNQYIWDTEVGTINSEISMTLREYEGSLMEVFLGGTLTENAAEATGAIDYQENVVGSSILDGSNGITVELTAGDSADLKEGLYVIKATAPAAATVYCMSDVDFQNGTDTTYTSDDLDVFTINVAAGDDVQASWGLTFGKNGTPAFTTDDTAEFYIRKPNTGSIELEFGQSGAEFTEVGVILFGQKLSDGTITSLELFKVKAAGMPISFNEKAWSEASVNLKAIYDSSENAIGVFRRTIAA
jgi:hypothetical protein